MAEDALLTTPFVNLALVPEAASSLLLHRAWSSQARSAQALIREGERYRAMLRAAGTPVPTNDLWIAALIA